MGTEALIASRLADVVATGGDSANATGDDDVAAATARQSAVTLGGSERVSSSARCFVFRARPKEKEDTRRPVSSSGGLIATLIVGGTAIASYASKLDASGLVPAQLMIVA